MKFPVIITFNNLIYNSLIWLNYESPGSLRYQKIMNITCTVGFIVYNYIN